jgi:hypothetical protein
MILLCCLIWHSFGTVGAKDSNDNNNTLVVSDAKHESPNSTDPIRFKKGNIAI